MRVMEAHRSSDLSTLKPVKRAVPPPPGPGQNMVRMKAVDLIFRDVLVASGHDRWRAVEGASDDFTICDLCNAGALAVRRGCCTPFHGERSWRPSTWVSDPRISPDGRFVAYNVRSTDWDANAGKSALWVLDRTRPDAPARLIQEKGATSPQWSADGQWLYFLSSRSGSLQLWRSKAGTWDASQMTNLPLDIAFFHLTADGRGLVAAIDVYPDCDTLACSKVRDEDKKKNKATGTVFTSTARIWNSYLDGRYINLFAVPFKADAPATDAVALTRGYEADIVSQPFGDESLFATAPDGRTVIFAAVPSGSAQIFETIPRASTPGKVIEAGAARPNGSMRRTHQRTTGSRFRRMARSLPIFRKGATLTRLRASTSCCAT